MILLTYRSVSPAALEMARSSLYLSATISRTHSCARLMALINAGTALPGVWFADCGGIISRISMPQRFSFVLIVNVIGSWSRSFVAFCV